ncbi:ubiquitin carboxyl-terminal hydrolase 36-like isoform X1 [Xenopus laevis]|uniref:Ubiquitin carboxyl-terminal hydrolase 36-like isoform X1 n=1 Tax=Xenopus laevis TaxID=8355 RepID=A0A8J1M3M2_XENLA|nr:ubiquitin carboxyl-terminal hydrolase 36-like isoform X1 [Xenopus laevis]
MVAYPEFIDIRPYTSEPKEEPITYGLHAVLVHAGTTCCYVKAPNGKWYNMNDQSVMLVDKATVLRQQVYLLFYTRFNNDEKRREPASSTQATLISQKPIITKPAIFGIDTMIKTPRINEKADNTLIPNNMATSSTQQANIIQPARFMIQFAKPVFQISENTHERDEKKKSLKRPLADEKESEEMPKKKMFLTRL